MTSVRTAVATTNVSKDKERGIWIGIDFGTTHCSVAIYDAARGGPKWIRLASAIPETKTKYGRMVPTQLVLSSHNTTTPTPTPTTTTTSNTNEGSTLLIQDTEYSVTIGYPAYKQTLDHDNENEHHRHPHPVVVYSIPHLKRNFAKNPEEFWIEAAQDSNSATTTTTTTPAAIPLLTWLDGVALVLKQLRMETDDYIKIHQTKKHLQTPGYGPCQHVVMGVPARYTTRQRHGMIEAARRAGFVGHISTVTESTAAAMAYGLFVGKRISTHHNYVRILVFDMGGGTTDVTVAVLHPPNRNDIQSSNTHSPPNNNDPSQRFQVESTYGDAELGGDDMDEAIVQYLIERHHISLLTNSCTTKRQLLRLCQKAKEVLTEQNETQIHWKGRTITLTRQEFEIATAPLLQRARTILDHDSMNRNSIDEVVLIGGATRVPAIRTMLREAFPHITELSTSVHPVSAVAQGCAIQAAWLSEEIPQHALESALMLDTTPYPLGILHSHHLSYALRGVPQQIIPYETNHHVFSELIPRDSQLPAHGSTLFTLSDPQQPGVTVLAVEYVPEDELFVVLNEFTFLLRQIENKVWKPKERQVEVGMRITQDGEVMVSIYDAYDPDHVRARYGTSTDMGGAVKDDTFSMEQIYLLIGCCFLFVLYVAMKLQFSVGTETIEEL